jgi:hypothetical protein
VRTNLLEQVATQVNAFHIRPQLEYDYVSVRQRLIFETLTQGVQYVLNNAVEGDVAEFGTASGFSAYTIARAMGVYREVYGQYLQMHGAKPKLLYLFDSFEGLPGAAAAADLSSPNVQSGRWREGTFKGLTREELTALCASVYDGDKLRIVPGWFKDSLKALPAGTKLAMAHLDCDLYGSTVEVLDHLFGGAHIAEGAVLFFDDWNCNRSSPRLGQRLAWREICEKYRVEYSDGGDYAVLGHKFIVHAGG